MSTRVEVDEFPLCDLCKYEDGPTLPALYDAKTREGPWAYMCAPCYQQHGVGLGTGRGQRLVLKTS